MTLTRPSARKDALILLVEDNEDDVLLTLRALERNATDPDEVMVVRDGAEALDYLYAGGPYADRDPSLLPSLMLLDINLPKLSGLEVLENLYADEHTGSIPVVMLTSSANEREVAQSYLYGANSYVQKPVNTREFDEVIQQMALYWLGLNVPPNMAARERHQIPLIDEGRPQAF